jgi:hypothetical protein
MNSINFQFKGEKIMRRNVFLTLVGSGIVCLALAGVSQATVPRAFVSINGSDLNPCSAVQPCRSFTQALSVVQAGGEIVVQDSGGYSTGFTINQSVTIDAAGFNASVINTAPGDLCTISAGVNDRVVLRGISFHGASIGNNAINVTQVGSLYVEHCSIAEFGGSGVLMANGGNLFVTNTDIRKCVNGLNVGTSGATSANLVAQDSRFTECSGFFSAAVGVSTSGTGTASGWLTNCTASDGTVGFTVNSSSGATAKLTLTNCRAFGNGIGLLASNSSTGSAVMGIAGCAVTKNGTGISTISSGGGTASVVGTGPGTNFIAGNTTDGATTGSVTLQ